MPETTLIDTLLTQARQQLALGDAEQALSLAQHAYACAPHRPEATLALGEILLHSGQYDAAHALLWPAAQQWPHVAALHRCLGLLEQQLGQREAAIDSLRWACTLDPGQHDAAFRLAAATNRPACRCRRALSARHRRLPGPRRRTRPTAPATGRMPTAVGTYRRRIRHPGRRAAPFS